MKWRIQIEMKHLTNKLLKDTLLVMSSNIINYAGMFVLAVMITRLTGINALGDFTYIFAISSILSVISEFGLSQLLIRKINSGRSSVFSLIRNVNIFRFFTSVICVIVTLLILALFSGKLVNLTYAVGLAVIIPKTFQSTYEAAIRALMKQALPSVIKSINALIQITIAYFILSNNGTLLGLFIMMITMESLTAVIFKLSAVYIWKKNGITFSRPVPFSFSGVYMLIKESFPFFGISFLSLSIPRVIIIILGSITSQLSVGIFSAASRFVNGIGLISGALYNTFYPAMTNPETSVETRYSIAKKVTLYAFLTGTVISFVIFFSAETLIELSFKIPAAVPLLKLMCFMVIPVLTCSMLQSYLLSQNCEKFIAYFYIVLWIFNLVFCIILVNLYGYWGAAITAVLLEYIILLTFFVAFIRNKKQSRPVAAIPK